MSKNNNNKYVLREKIIKANVTIMLEVQVQD